MEISNKIKISKAKNTNSFKIQFSEGQLKAHLSQQANMSLI